MNRPVDTLDPGGLHVIDGVTPQQRHIARTQPRQHRRMQAGATLAVGPRAFGRPLRPPPATNQQRVARTNANPGELLPGLEILDIDGRAGREPFDILEQRHVDENAAGNVAGAHSVGGGFPAPRRGEREGKAVVAYCRLARLAPDRALIVTQRIEVRIQAVMDRQLDDVECSANLAGLWINSGHAVYVLAEASRVDTGPLERIDLQRDGLGFLHERERLFRLFRGDEIQKSPLILLAPSAPVRQLPLPFLERLQRHETVGFLGRWVRGERLSLLLTEHKRARDNNRRDGDGERADPTSIQHGWSPKRRINPTDISVQLL